MSKTSKMIMGAALLATAVTAILPAQAATHDVMVGYEAMDIDFGAMGVLDVDTATISSTGSYDSGLSYELDIAEVTVEGMSDTTYAALDVHYAPGLFGVGAKYATFSTGDDMLELGASANYEWNGVDAYANLVTNVEDLGEVIRVEVGGSYDVNHMATVSAEIRDGWAYGVAAPAVIDVDTRVHLIEGTFVEVGYSTNLQESAAPFNAYAMGVGFAF